MKTDEQSLDAMQRFERAVETAIDTFCPALESKPDSDQPDAKTSLMGHIFGAADQLLEDTALEIGSAGFIAMGATLMQIYTTKKYPGTLTDPNLHKIAQILVGVEAKDDAE